MEKDAPDGADHHSHEHEKHVGGHRFPVERLHLLKDEARQPPEPILRATGVTLGAVAVDVGAGAGFWTLPLSNLVGASGTVYAVDIEQVMLDELHALVKEKQLPNVRIVPSTEEGIPLPDAVAQFAVAGFVVHEPVDPAAFVREIVRLLQPGGRLLIVEWHRKQTESGPPMVHRLAQEEMQTLLTEAGLTVRWLDAPNPDVYVAVGTLPA
jgi:ubiquinone/menaquinone biosynthesis C-methylase UbiE